MDKCKLGVLSQEWLKIEVNLLSATKKSYMLCRLAQQQMTLSNLEWPSSASRAILAVAELLVLLCACKLYNNAVLMSCL